MNRDLLDRFYKLKKGYAQFGFPVTKIHKLKTKESRQKIKQKLRKGEYEND